MIVYLFTATQCVHAQVMLATSLLVSLLVAIISTLQYKAEKSNTDIYIAKDPSSQILSMIVHGYYFLQMMYRIQCVSSIGYLATMQTGRYRNRK